MGFPHLSPEVHAAIREAPPEMTNKELADQLGVNRETISKWRERQRQEQDEIRRQVLSAEYAKAASDMIPRAVYVLRSVMDTAWERFQEDKKASPRLGGLAKDSACAILDRLGDAGDYRTKLAGMAPQTLADSLAEDLIESGIEPHVARAMIAPLLPQEERTSKQPEPVSA